MNDLWCSSGGNAIPALARRRATYSIYICSRGQALLTPGPWAATSHISAKKEKEQLMKKTMSVIDFSVSLCTHNLSIRT